jgi:hypothetical protein
LRERRKTIWKPKTKQFKMMLEKMAGKFWREKNGGNILAGKNGGKIY